ncbi:MAG: type IV pilus assembly protein PilM [Planctomycetes bacterium]|nr:type IV pilus assembly protein PilM [Planctomycetota bacterium]
MAKAAWGLDVSNFSIKAVKLVRSGSSVQLAAMDVEDIPRPGEGEDHDPTAAMKEAIAEIVKRNRMKDAPIVSCFPSHAAFNRFIKLPPVEEKKIPEIVRYEAQQHIPFPLDDVIWDYQKIDKAYEVGEEMEVVLFAIKRDIVTSFLETLQGAEVVVDALQFAPVALYNYVMHDQDPGNSCVILDIGGDNTDLVIIDGEKFWIRNLPIAGNDITKALQKKFQIPYDEAEKLKVNAARSPQATKIFGVIQPVLRDLVGEVHRSIGYYKSLSKTAKFDKILMVGSASKTLNFQKFLSQNLQMTVNRLSKLGNLEAGSRVDDTKLQNTLCSLGVACGLALQGLGVASNKINLLPPEMIRKKEASQKRPFVAAAVGVVGLLVGYMAMSAGAKATAAQQNLTRVQTVLGSQEEMENKYKKVRGRIPPIEAALREVGKVAPERDLSLKVLNAINQLPAIQRNGDLAVAEEEKLWILSLGAESYDEIVEVRTPKIPEGMTAEQAENPEFLSQAEFVVERRKTPRVRIIAVVGIACRKNAEGKPDVSASQQWVKDKLVNPIAEKFTVDKPSPVPDPADPIEKLVTKEHETGSGGGGFGGGLGGGVTPKGEGRYFRFNVQWNLIVGVRERAEAKKAHDAAAPSSTPAEAAPTPPPKEGSNNK